MFIQRTLQRLLFQIHVRYMLMIVRLFGVWPYLIDEKAETFRTTWYLKLLPLAVIFSVIASLALGTPAFKTQDITWHSVAANLLVVFYGFSFITCFFSTYIDQHYRLKSIEALIERCRRLAALRISKYFIIEEFAYVKLLLLYTLKSKVIMIFTAYSIIIRMYVTSIMSGFAVLSFFAINYVISIVPNIFFGIVLIAYYLFKQINIKVKRISEAAITLNTLRPDLTLHFRMQRFCELSDQLDEMALLHLDLCTLMNAINSVTSIQVTSHLTIKFMSLLVQLFFVYIYVSVWIQQEGGRQFPITMFVTGIQTAILNAFELTLLVQACHIMVEEVTYCLINLILPSI